MEFGFDFEGVQESFRQAVRWFWSQVEGFLLWLDSFPTWLKVGLWLVLLGLGVVLAWWLKKCWDERHLIY